jgi:ribosomal protein L11 methyltransferase
LASVPALDLQWSSGADAEETIELVHALLDDFDPQAIHDAPSGWRVFFKTAQHRESAALALARSLAGRLDTITPVDVADEEWARRSQANLTAVRVGRLTVAPPWDIPTSSDTSDGVIVIDPSTGFGTGHHETTRLCLALLQDLPLAGTRVADVGTGSGVLAIGAARLGAASVVAMDEDPEALRNARENVTRNGVSAVVDVREADLAEFQADPADVVLANLTAGVLERHAGRLAGLVADGGVLIVSGFSPTEADVVVRCFPFPVVRTMDEGEWSAALMQKAARTRT